MNAKDAVEGLAAWHADTGRLWIAQSSFALACRAHAEPPHVGRRPAQKGSLSLCSSSAWDDIQTSAVERTPPPASTSGPHPTLAVPDGRAGGPAVRPIVCPLFISPSMQPAKSSMHRQCSDPPGQVARGVLRVLL